MILQSWANELSVVNIRMNLWKYLYVSSVYISSLLSRVDSFSTPPHIKLFFFSIHRPLFIFKWLKRNVAWSKTFVNLKSKCLTNMPHKRMTLLDYKIVWICNVISELVIHSLLTHILIKAANISQSGTMHRVVLYMRFSNGKEI